MKILISAGGTAEPIDSVRSITNTGTGRLGSLIAEAFAREERVEEVHYVCDPRAVRPFGGMADGSAKTTAGDSLGKACPQTKIFEHVIHGTQELLETMRTILLTKDIDAVIQSMAVSDYTTDCAFDAAEFSEALLPMLRDVTDAESLQEALLEAAAEADLVKAGKKISSYIEHPLILLKKTPKVLPQLKDFRPGILLVGFKLLSNVSKEELFSVARHLMEASRCDYVLANDYSTITPTQHIGFLLGADGSIQQFNTKQNIAEGICREVIGRI